MMNPLQTGLFSTIKKLLGFPLLCICVPLFILLQSNEQVVGMTRIHGNLSVSHQFSCNATIHSTQTPHSKVSGNNNFCLDGNTMI